MSIINQYGLVSLDIGARLVVNCLKKPEQVGFTGMKEWSTWQHKFVAAHC
jgi:hypothetical protein